MVRQARRLARTDDPGRPDLRTVATNRCRSRAIREPKPKQFLAANPATRRDHAIVGIGLVLLGVLLGIALFWPASNGDLELDTLVGLSFGLILLVVTGTLLQFRRKGLPVSVTGALVPVLVLAALVAMAIAVLKTYY